MVAVTIPFKIDAEGDPEIPVKITNTKNNKSVIIPMLPDTGYTYTTVDTKSARPLGLDDKDIVGESDDSDVYNLRATMGPISIPIQVFVLKGKENVSINVLGMADIHKFFKVTITKTHIRFETKPVQTTSAFVESNAIWYGYRKRI